MTLVGINQRGTSVKGMSIPEILDACGLNWTVELSPRVYGKFGEHSLPGVFDAYRSDNSEYIGEYKTRKPLQNAEMLQVFSDFLQQGGLSLSTVGFNNNVLWASAELPIEQQKNRLVGDITTARIIISDSHQSGRGLQVATHFERLICLNGMSSPVSQKVGVISHAGKIDIAKTRAVLNYALQSIDQKFAIDEQLANTPMTIQQATMMLISQFGKADMPVDAQPEVVKTCLKLFEGEAIGGDLLTVYNTAYGLLQSVTQYFTHSTVDFSKQISGTIPQSVLSFQRQLVSVSN